MDGDVQQAKVGTGRGKGRHKQQLLLQRTGGVDSGAGYYVWKSLGSCGRTKGMKKLLHDPIVNSTALTDSQVGIYIHLDPPAAHTINIEPMTPEYWESMVYLPS